MRKRIHKKEKLGERFIVIEKLDKSEWNGWYVCSIDGDIIGAKLFKRFNDAKRYAMEKTRETMKTHYIFKVSSAYIVDIMTEQLIREMFT